jgi:hypothetical protein
VITRFRLEAAGDSEIEVQRQLRYAADEIVQLENTMRAEWEVTDSVISLHKAETRRLRKPVWCGRVVLKRKGDTNGNGAG